MRVGWARSGARRIVPLVLSGRTHPPNRVQSRRRVRANERPTARRSAPSALELERHRRWLTRAGGSPLELVQVRPRLLPFASCRRPVVCLFNATR
jgi:hypothetical protein